MRVGDFAALANFEAKPESRQGPGGAAEAFVISNDWMSAYAVRFNAAASRVYFSLPDQACSAIELEQTGFVRLETANFFQPAGGEHQVISVNDRGQLATANVPAIEVRMLGVRVRAQIDTGYASGAASDLSARATPEIQINQALFELIAPRLGSSVATVPYNAEDGSTVQVQVYESPAGVDYLNPRDGSVIAHVNRVRLLLKKQDGIATWRMPVAQLSAEAFFEAFPISEFRKDQTAVWVVPRAPE